MTIEVTALELALILKALRTAPTPQSVEKDVFELQYKLGEILAKG